MTGIKPISRLLVILISLIVWAGLAVAQDNSEPEEQSRLVRFVEDQLSASNRQIRLIGLQGTLSSDVQLERITISDDDGAWLTIEKPQLVWNRLALLRGRLSIEKLSAESLIFPRNPKPDTSNPSAESSSFAVPDLPVAINIGALSIGRAEFGEPVFGLASVLSLDGNLSLEDGNLETKLAIQRLDGPGGDLNLAATAQGETLDVDFSLSEPSDGVIANVLNIPERPPVSLTVTGGGAFDALDVDLALDVDGNRTLDGNLTTSRGFLANATRAEFILSGPLASILPEDERAFFGGKSELVADLLLLDSGVKELRTIRLTSGAVKLNATGKLAADGFPQQLQATFALQSEDGTAMKLPGDSGTRLAGADLKLDFGTSADGQWTLDGTLTDLVAQGFRLGAIRLDGDGASQSLADPEQRSLTYDISVAARDLQAEDEAVAQAVGETLNVKLAGSYEANQPFVIDVLSADAEAADVTVSGLIAEGRFDGTAKILADDLRAFAGLADRPLAGTADLGVDGTVALVGGGFDLVLDGSLSDATIGQEIADTLLAGTTRLTGGAARGTDGLRFDNLRIANQQVTAGVNGMYASDRADLTASAELASLGLINETSSGRTTTELRLTRDRAENADGEAVLQPLSIMADVRLPNGELSERNVQDLKIAFTGEELSGRVTGDLSGDGFVGGERIQLQAAVEYTEMLTALRDLVAQVGGATVNGSVELVDGIADGQIDIDARDISSLAALALLDAGGSVNGTVLLTNEGANQSVDANLTASDLAYAENRIGEARINAAITNALKQPLINGQVDASNIKVGAIGVRSLALDAEPQGDGFAFSAAAEMDDGADIDAAGNIAFAGAKTTIDLAQLDVRSPIANAQLAKIARIILENGTTEIAGVALAIGNGSLTAEGTIADQIDVDVDANSLPLDIANAFADQLDLGGTLSGAIQARGTQAAPQVSFDISGSQVTAAALRNAQVTPLAIGARGRFANNEVALDNLDVTNGQGVSVSATGTIPLSGNGLLVDADLNAVPVALANGFVPDLGAQGQLTGTVRATGSTSAPQVAFNIDGSGLSVRQLSSNGVTPLSLSASGEYNGQNVQLSSVQVSNGQGIDIGASGAVPLSGGGLNVSVDGSAPLSVANSFLVGRGTRVDGLGRFQVQVTGSTASPGYSGLVSLSGGSVVDPQSNLRLNAINVLAGIEGNRISIRSANATLGQGGGISLTGTVALDAGYNADLRLGLNGARYSDGQLFFADLDSNLAITGPLTGGALIAGDVNVNRAEITIPETFAGSTDLLPVTHVSPDPPTQRTLARLASVLPKEEGGSPSAPFRLDIQVIAPNQIFVRGRGLDSELGGQLRLAGPVTNIAPVGGFDLIRGRVSILNKRLDFTEGRVTLTGSLDPFINFVAQTTSGDVTAFIRLIGRASDLKLELSSSPELPEDEVLAQVLFGESIANLSPLQIASLASAAAGLGGGGGLVDGLRKGLGVDDLDITTGSDGNVAVRAGRYINENIYLGVEAGSSGVETTINLDITDSLKAKGAVGSDGNSSVGVFFEKDY